jgi:hypothetical protein
LPVRRQAFCTVRCSQKQRDRRKQEAKRSTEAQ